MNELQMMILQAKIDKQEIRYCTAQLILLQMQMDIAEAKRTLNKI